MQSRKVSIVSLAPDALVPALTAGGSEDEDEDDDEAHGDEAF